MGLALLRGGADDAIKSPRKRPAPASPPRPGKSGGTRKSRPGKSGGARPAGADRVALMVVGLGCSVQDAAAMQQIRDTLAPVMGMPIEILCNPSLASTIRNIAKTYCHIIPSKKDPFVQKVKEMTLAHLAAGKKVHLMGFSYGGSVAARVAESISGDGPRLSGLRVSTYGSVYVPDPSRTVGVRTRHFLYANDVALRCNSMNPGKHGASWHVTWLLPAGGAPARRGPKYLPFGTRKEWVSHNDYWDVASQVAHGRAPRTQM